MEEGGISEGALTWEVATLESAQDNQTPGFIRVRQGYTAAVDLQGRRGGEIVNCYQH